MPEDPEYGIAATKLRPPAPPMRLVERSRLAAVLDGGLRGGVALVLVSAPAGSGKSTLLAAWADQHPTPSAWMQIEDDDTDPARFWSALVSAIGRPRPQVAARVGPLVAGSQGDGRVVVPALVNELVDGDEPLIVVLDDYHLIDDPEIHRGVERLIDLCPPQLTLVIATRFDPPFRLGRLRVRNQICELRADDLRFAADEASGLLGVVSDTMAPALIDALCARTEGWAAGLVLAGLSLERAPDPAVFVESFRGDDQLVVGYLSDELLVTLDADDRRRLLETSVLAGLTGPLVDAVTQSSGGREWLTATAASNQLIVRLDSQGEWFRCHHLLRDLLVLEAQRAFPDRLPELHSRAATWFESHHDHGRAVEHRLAAGDLAEAMHLMRIVGPDLLGKGQVRTLRHLLDQIGPDAASDTVCALLWGWYGYLTARYDDAQRWLETALEVAPPTFDRVIATSLSINVALGRGDVASALASARSVTEHEQLALRPAELATAVGAAYAWAGLAAEARSALRVAVARSTTDHRMTAHVLALVSLSIAEANDGETTAARAAADAAASTAESYGLPGYHGIAPAYAVQARTAEDPDAARTGVGRALDAARRGSTNLGLAYTLAVCGDTLLDLGDDAGSALLDEARSVVGRCTDPGVAATTLSRALDRHRVGSPPAGRSPALVEQLSEREMAVLRHLPTQLSQREIAGELYVSLNTVKTHCSAIYRKLGVRDRNGAVQAARELRLI